jgi:hypothetical protein
LGGNISVWLLLEVFQSLLEIRGLLENDLNFLDLAELAILEQAILDPFNSSILVLDKYIHRIESITDTYLAKSLNLDLLELAFGE